ncbi:MAG: hypothetical protein AAFY45_34130 [Bacteroidota bacterium]
MLNLLILWMLGVWASPIALHGQENISWKDLQNLSYEMSYDSAADYMMMTPVYGEDLLRLQGQLVKIRGYILPMDTEGSAYVLSAFPFSSCFFCGGGGKETVVELILTGNKNYRVDQIKTFEGKLKLNEDPFGLNYILEEAKEMDES